MVTFGAHLLCWCLWLAYTATLLIDVFCRIDRDELTELIARSCSALTPVEVAKLVRARTQLVQLVFSACTGDCERNALQVEDIFEQFDEDLSGALDFNEFKRAASSHKDLLSLFFDPRAFSFNSAQAAAGGAPSKPAVKECWEGVDCTRADCRFSHPTRSLTRKGRKALRLGGGTAQKVVNCRWGDDCTKPDCKFKHPV